MKICQKIREIRNDCGSIRCYLLGHDIRWHKDGVYCERCGMPENFSAPVLDVPWMTKEWLYRIKLLIKKIARFL
jgi:hypothetical protein